MPTIYQDEIIKVRRNTDQPIKYKAYNSEGTKLCNVEFNTSKENGLVNGLTNEAIIAIVIDRLKCQNKSDASLYNDKAIECLKASLGALEAGIKDSKSKSLSSIQ